MAAARDRLESSVPVFAALGDATRLRLVARLCAGGPQSIAHLTEGSRVTRQAVSKHLRVLAGAGLVRGSRQGRESRWALQPRRLEEARRYLDAISAEWDRRLERLGRHLDLMAGVEPGKARGPAKRRRSPPGKGGAPAAGAAPRKTASRRRSPGDRGGPSRGGKR